MNNHDSIKWFLNVNLSIIIFCFSIVSIVNIMYAIESKILFFELFWLLFLDYFMIDFLFDINNEKKLFIPEHYTIKNYKVKRVIYLTE